MSEHDDRVEIHHPLSKGKLPELRFEHLGRLRWSTRTNLCFEHARRGSAVVGTMLLTKRDRDEVLVALEAAAGI